MGIVGGILFLMIMIPVWTTEIAVTNHRLIFKQGLLSRAVADLQLRAIEQVGLQQGFIARLFNMGRVQAHGTGVEICPPACDRRSRGAAALDSRSDGNAATGRSARAPVAVTRHAPRTSRRQALDLRRLRAHLQIWSLTPRQSLIHSVPLTPARWPRMAVEFNHTIIRARDSKTSATFLAEVLGLPAPVTFGPFEVVTTTNGVSLDFMEGKDEIHSRHFAFLVSESEFDEIFGRIRERGLSYWADPARNKVGQINHQDGGRGVYFEDPNGHLLEILTRPYGSGV